MKEIILNMEDIILNFRGQGGQFMIYLLKSHVPPPRLFYLNILKLIKF